MVLTSTKSGGRTPVVVVGNKVDLDTRELTRAETEARVMFEWNWGYKECSAKLGEGVSQVVGKIVVSSFRFLPRVSKVFLELLNRVKQNSQDESETGFGPDLAHMRRRKSLPQVRHEI